MTPEIQATLDRLNAQYAAGGTQWGYDDAKRAYFTIEGNGAKRYQSTTGMPGDATASAKPAGGGLAHGNPQWNQQTGQWDTPIDWGKLGSYAVGAGLGAGALNAAGLLGGAGAAPTSAAADTALFTDPTAVATIAGNGGALGSVAPALGTTAGNVVAGSGLPAAAGAGGDALSQLLKNAPSLAALLPMLTGSGLSGGSGSAANSPQLNALLDMSVQRAQRQDPLHQAVTQLAMTRLPTNVQR